MPAVLPAPEPPDGQGRRGGDGDGFVQACVHPQPDLRQFFRFIPDDVTGFRGRNSPHGLGVDAPHRVRTLHPHRMPIRFIVPIDILREPDDVTLVRFSLAQKHGEAVRPIVPHRRQSDGAGAPVRHLPAEIASDLPRASAIAAAQRIRIRPAAQKIQRPQAFRRTGPSPEKSK